MSSPKTALARLSDSGPRVPRVPAPAGPEGGFGSLTPERARVLLFVAARASSVTLLAIVVLVLAALLAAGSGLEGAGGAIAASWLAVHQVPLVIGKTTLGLLPLLPTGLLFWLAARDCARAVQSDPTRADLGWIVGAALAGPLLITAVCLAVADDAAAVVALQPPNTSAAFGWVIGLHLLAAAVGIGSRQWRKLAALAPIDVPDWLLPGARAGLRAAQRLLVMAAIIILISLLAHWSRIGETYQAAGNVAGFLGLTLLSLAYLPNVLVDVVAVVLGGSVEIGGGSLSLFAVEGARIPAVPIAAAVPLGPAAAWWPVLLLAPAAVGVLGGLDIGRGTDDRPTAPWATLTSAGVAAVLLGLLGALAGGELGSFGRIGPNALLLTVLVFVWLAVPGYVGMFCAQWFVLPAALGGRGDVADTDYADDDYYDEFDEYEDEFESDGDTESDADGEYDYYDDEFDDYADATDGHERVVEMDGELLDEQTALTVQPHADSLENSDIVDAEVVEADLPDTGAVDGR
ncbi:hypothetical protein HLB23_09960 [Nocardia uniformis]|uniref:Uncharacterized protein n=1 Tax=Nocardia uniformis TaxID=53432 RepID=A0A849CB42_9NOCA|nr:DUF6350 family protein [Nocardia uniformis]NNH70181.1 hypothetical protein [Nocardia uniformis]